MSFKDRRTAGPGLGPVLAGMVLLCIGSIFAGGVDWDRLLTGEVLVEAVDGHDGIPGVRASFVVDADPESIWAALVDYENFTRIFKEMD